jgi:hypothetical protein
MAPIIFRFSNFYLVPSKSRPTALYSAGWWGTGRRFTSVVSGVSAEIYLYTVEMGEEGQEAGGHYRVMEEWERLGLDKRVDWENLSRVFERLDLKKDGRIDKEELGEMFSSLGHRPRKNTEYGLSEVEDIIWEVPLRLTTREPAVTSIWTVRCHGLQLTTF